MLKVEGLTVTRAGIPLLEGVAFTIGKGQRLGIIGATGSGKSLVALAILGLLPDGAHRNGSIVFDETQMPTEDTMLAALRAKRIGAILQNAGAALDPLRTLGAQANPAALTEVGLDADLAARYPDALSPADLQLAAIGIALAQQPDLLIADEPTVGLDVLATRRVYDLIARHCTERSMSLLLITQDLKAIAHLCDRIAVMKDGRAVEVGDKPDILGHPRHDATRTLLTAGRHRARTLMRAPIGGTLLDVRHVSRRFVPAALPFISAGSPTIALDDVNLAIRAGESLALIGPGGSGKSTLLRIIAGLERTNGGELEFDHEVYHGLDLPLRIRRDITFVAPDPSQALDPHLTIGEIIAEPLRLETLRPVEELSARIIEVMQAVGLSPQVLPLTPRDFTLSERQHIAIARALITRPRLVLLDDPVCALDAASRGEVLVMLNRLRADFGVTFLVAGTDLDLVRVVADRVIVIDKGKIVETGTPAQVLGQAQQPITQQLIAAALPEVGIVPVF